MATQIIPAATRRQVLKVVIISLLIDLVSFTFILPLFPKLLEFYRKHDADRKDSILNSLLQGLNAYKNAFARPINDRYDIVLLGGALGSLFSLLQAVVAPIIGRLSDKHGRRKVLLWCMMGNILSVALWLAAVDFRTFLASRIVGGLSEGNVQLATAIATDISDDQSRASTMALIGACFSVAFTVGPAIGAALTKVSTVAANPFGTAAAGSLILVVVETVYLYLYLPETLPSSVVSSRNKGQSKKPKQLLPRSTNGHALLNFTHFAFLLLFSGIEFSLPFVTYDLFSYGSSQTGRLLGFIGLIASVLQGSVTRRLNPLTSVRLGVVSCTLGLFLLDRMNSERMLYTAAALLAVTSATVVTGLRSLSSFEAGVAERGGKLGNHRSWGQAGRSLGPVIFCSLYWWAGRQAAYVTGAIGMMALSTLVFALLKSPSNQPDTTINAARKKTS